MANYMRYVEEDWNDKCMRTEVKKIIIRISETL